MESASDVFHKNLYNIAEKQAVYTERKGIRHSMYANFHQIDSTAT